MSLTETKAATVCWVWLATVTATATYSLTPAIACAIAGTVGGLITQLLTSEERRPSLRVFIGELMASCVMGYIAFSVMENHDPKTLVAAVLAGGSGSMGWHKLVDLYQKRLGIGE